MAHPTKEQIENVISGQMQELMEKVPANSGVSAAFYCPSHPYLKKVGNSHARIVLVFMESGDVESKMWI